MDGLPSRDTVAAFEARLGKPLMTVLIWLMAIAIGVGALGVIITGARAAYAFFYPMLPASSVISALQKFAVVAVLGFLATFSKYVAAILQKVRNIDRVDTNAQAIAEVLSAESQRVEDLIARFDRLEKRFNYVEDKVGSELFDLVLARAQHAVPHPVTDKERTRLEHVRGLLREAAEKAKSVEKASGDMDKAANQGWLWMNIGTLLGEVLTFDEYKAFRDFQDGRRMKAEQHKKNPDGRDALVADGEYLARLADRLNFEDIDPEAQLPPSFQAWLERK
jgi:ABC-type multidrug transport system fused ATPase/permease subunit